MSEVRKARKPAPRKRSPLAQGPADQAGSRDLVTIPSKTSGTSKRSWRPSTADAAARAWTAADLNELQEALREQIASINAASTAPAGPPSHARRPQDVVRTGGQGAAARLPVPARGLHSTEAMRLPVPVGRGSPAPAALPCVQGEASTEVPQLDRRWLKALEDFDPEVDRLAASVGKYLRVAGVLLTLTGGALGAVLFQQVTSDDLPSVSLANASALPSDLPQLRVATRVVEAPEVEAAEADEEAAELGAADTVVASITSTTAKFETADAGNVEVETKAVVETKAATEIKAAAEQVIPPAARTEPPPSPRKAEPDRTIRVKEYVRLRSKPRGEVITVIPAGANAELLGCQEWCELRYGGQRGFAYKSLVLPRTAGKS